MASTRRLRARPSVPVDNRSKDCNSISNLMTPVRLVLKAFILSNFGRLDSAGGTRFCNNFRPNCQTLAVCQTKTSPFPAGHLAGIVSFDRLSCQPDIRSHDRHSQ